MLEIIYIYMSGYVEFKILGYEKEGQPSYTNLVPILQPRGR